MMEILCSVVTIHWIQLNLWLNLKQTATKNNSYSGRCLYHITKNSKVTPLHELFLESLSLFISLLRIELIPLEITERMNQ